MQGPGVIIFNVNVLSLFMTNKLDTVQYFLIKLGIKALMHLWEISIFSLNHVIVRPTKIKNSADKNWAHFQKIKYPKNKSFHKSSVVKVGVTEKNQKDSVDF